MRGGRAVWFAALVALVVAASPAAANSHAGNVAVHALIDTEQFPGVTCVFRVTPDDYLQRIRVRAPIVYAFDRTAGTDTQWVGWRYRIQSSSNGTDWADVQGGTSAFVKAKATDGYNAQWTSRVWDVPQPPVGLFRVIVAIRWYSPTSGHVDGHALLSPVYYLYAGKDVTRYVDTRCGDTLG
jgi:hypothetical protein